MCAALLQRKGTESRLLLRVAAAVNTGLRQQHEGGLPRAGSYCSSRGPMRKQACQCDDGCIFRAILVVSANRGGFRRGSLSKLWRRSSVLLRHATPPLILQEAARPLVKEVFLRRSSFLVAVAFPSPFPRPEGAREDRRDDRPDGGRPEVFKLVALMSALYTRPLTGRGTKTGKGRTRGQRPSLVTRSFGSWVHPVHLHVKIHPARRKRKKS